MEMDYIRAMELMGMEEGTDFSYIQLTQAFAKAKRAIEDEEMLEDIAEAYDYLKNNFKKLKSNVQNSSKVKIDNDIFPSLIRTNNDPEVIIESYPVIMTEEQELLPITIITSGTVKVPSIVVGSFIDNQTIATYHEGKMYIGPAEINYLKV